MPTEMTSQPLVPATSPIKPSQEDGFPGDFKFNMPPTQARLALIDELQRLLNEHPDKFAVRAETNSFYQNMLRVGTVLNTPAGKQVMLMLFYGKQRESGHSKVEIDIFPMRSVPAEARTLTGNCIYRLDAVVGDELRDEFEKLNAGLASIGVSQEIIDSIGYTPWKDGKFARLSSKWAETELTDQQALQGVITATGLSLPSMESWHGTLPEFMRGAQDSIITKLLE